MRLGKLDLNLLIALDVLIEERSVSGAARRLNLSQPALTGALNRLRAFFADELLVQTGRHMTLTPKAEELLWPVRDALQLIRSRITTSGDFDPATAIRKFVIIASEFVFHVLLADVIAGAAATAPGITFDIITPDVRASELLDRGNVDLLITIGQYMSQTHPRLELFRDDRVIICWTESRHRLGIDPDGFSAAGHAAAYFGAEKHPTLTETFFAEKGVTRHIELRLPNPSSLPFGVIGTDRIATMYRRHAKYFASFLPIKLLEMPFQLPSVLGEVQWHKMRDKDRGLKWLISHLKESASKLPAL
jgi:LysR family nod box-dependent transcriptional activator